MSKKSDKNVQKTVRKRGGVDKMSPKMGRKCPKSDKNGPKMTKR